MAAVDCDMIASIASTLLEVSDCHYIPIGWMGATAFEMDSNATTSNIISRGRPNIVALISTFIFPLGEFPPCSSLGPGIRNFEMFYHRGA